MTVLFKAVIFDNDGTIVDSEAVAMPVAIQLLNTILTERDLPPYDDEAQVRLAGKPFRTMLAMAAEEKGTTFTSTEIEEFVNREEEAVIEAFLTNGISPTDGAYEGIDALCDAGVLMAVASTSSLKRVQTCLQLCELTPFFGRHVYSAKDSIDPPMPKPQPHIYLHTADKLGVPIADCLALEDSLGGIESALRAGVGCVLVFTGASHFPDEASRQKRWEDAIELRKKLGCEHIEMRSVQTLGNLAGHLNRNLTGHVRGHEGEQND